MAYVKKDLHNVGDKVTTTKKHEDYRGYFEPGTKVTVVSINKNGYTISDDKDNVVPDIGFTI
mgnify:CR=1 FL=1